MFRSLPFFAFAALLAVFTSCQRHHLGEMPEVQKENLHPLSAQSEEAQPAFPTSRVSGATVTPTPANFFPKDKP